MLQTIREHTQGWIASIIIGIIILSFALWGIHSYFIGGGATPVVAVVNGIDITRNQLAATYERLRRQAQYNTTVPITLKDESSLKNRALQALIDVEVLKQSSLSQGYLVNDQQVENYLETMPAFQVNGQFSIDRFQQVLSSSQLNPVEFVELIKTSLLIDQPKLGIVFTSFALPDEINHTIKIVNQEREIQYLTISNEYFLKQKMTIPPVQVERYYKEHLSQFMTPEQVKVDYVELSLQGLTATMKPTETELLTYYNENLKSYMTPASWKIDDIFIPIAVNAKQEEIDQAAHKADLAYQALKKGDSFNQVAKKFTKLKLLEKGFAALNQFPTELQANILDLKENDTFSQPIKTNSGYIILKLLAKKESVSQSFEEVKSKVKAAYLHQQAEEKFAQLRERLADLAYEHPDSLDHTAKTLNLPIKSSEFFSKQKPGKDISQYKKVRNAAFSNEVLTLRNNSDVLQIEPETVVVIHLNKHAPANLLPLKSMSQQIENNLVKQQAEKQAQQTALSIKEKLKTGASLQSIADTYRFQWHKVGYIGHYSNKVDSAILDIAFRMPRPNSSKSQLVFDTAKLADGYAVIALQAVKDGVISDKKQYDIFAEQVQSSEGLYEYELYKQAQIRDANIKLVS